MNFNYPTTTHINKTIIKALLYSSASIICSLFVTISTSQATTDFKGSLKSVTITDAAGTNAPPAAVIEYTKTGDTYSFDASKSSDSDGSITSYKWDFGDGTKAEGITTTHQFAAEPTATTLTVIDDKGGVAISQTTVKLYTAPFDIIVDDADSAAFSTSGTWSQSSSSPGYYNVGYKVAPAGTGTSQAKWTMKIPTSGSYQLFCMYTVYTNRATNAPYAISNNGKPVATKIVNQTANGGAFFPIGTYSLLEGSLEIVLSNAANGYVIADAVKATYNP